MFRFYFILLCGFILGAVVIENKQYFSKAIPVPVAFLPDGGQYDGELLKGELNEFGRIVWPSGDYYEGTFKNGLFHGLGELKTANVIYNGDFEEGVARGKGEITFDTGEVYAGEVDFGRANGEGVMQLADAGYSGSFKDNRFHGQGVLTYHSGDRYEGEFVDGQFEGQGILNYADGRSYRGGFVQGKMHGEGEYRDADNRYEGEFQQGRYHGRGELSNDHMRYVGEFANGVFHGAGVYTASDGASYRGEFEQGVFHGQGIMEQADGERYEGAFARGTRHGEGSLMYPKPVDGIQVVKGVWRYGRLVTSDNPLVEHNAGAIVEEVLYQQAQRVESMLEDIDEHHPDRVDLYFVGIAGDGNQGVFRREVNFIRERFDTIYDTKNKSALLINGNVSYATVPLATKTSIERTLQGVAEKMDAENDILFIYFTSHGSPDFHFQLAQQGLQLNSLSAEQLGDIISELPVKHKVVVISACYAGGYVQPVKNDFTMVMVAASADKTSFGCTDTGEMTYFGEALFKDALPISDTFADAFDRARDIVRGREAKEGFDFSNPLIFKPKAIREQLALWREDLSELRQEQNRLMD